MRVLLSILLMTMLLSACGANKPSSLEVSREGVTSAVVNLILANQDLSINALAIDSSLLFQAAIAEINLPEFSYEQGEQAFIALSADTANEQAWDIALHPLIPTAYVLDVSDSTLNANLTNLTVPRFDVVSSNSTLNLTMPSSSAQLALDANNSTVTITMPTGASPQLSQFVSHGSFITMQIAEGLSFDGGLSISTGGFTLTVPSSTGVQVIVESAEQSEISLPNLPRINAEVMSYSTINFGTAEARVILRVNLNGAAVRVEQE